MNRTGSLIRVVSIVYKQENAAPGDSPSTEGKFEIVCRQFPTPIEDGSKLGKIELNMEDMNALDMRRKRPSTPL